jgi:hypothetical protein
MLAKRAGSVKLRWECVIHDLPPMMGDQEVEKGPDTASKASQWF